MREILAIDPGTSESAFLMWDGKSVLYSGHVENPALLQMARTNLRVDGTGFLPRCTVAIEMVACYGMAVGKEVFETCLIIGQLKEAFESKGAEVRLIYRKDVKLHLCQSMRAKDANIRTALIDKHGAPGTKAKPGVTYGISKHLWSALAIADFVSDAEIQTLVRKQ